MEIHIQLAGMELGPYSEKQVRDYLEEGLLSPTDPARFEGATNWEPVGEMLAKLPKLAMTAPAEAKEAAAVISEKEKSLASQPLPSGTPSSSQAPVILNPGDPIHWSPPLVVKSLAKKSGQAGKGGGVSQPIPKLGGSSGKLPEQPLPSPVKVIAKKTKLEGDERSSAPIPLPTAPLVPSPSVIPKQASQDVSASASAPIMLNPGNSSKAIGASGTLPSVIRALSQKPERVVIQSAPAPSVPVNLMGPASHERPMEMSLPLPIKVLPKKSQPKTATPIQLAPPLPLGPAPSGPVAVVPSEPTTGTTVTPPPLPSRVRSKKKNFVWTRQHTFGAYFVGGGIALFCIVYFCLPYYSTHVLWDALKSGNQAQLDKYVDFPVLRESLKTQIEAQVAKSESSVALAMIENSIDLYVTPESVSSLVNKADHFDKTDQQQVVTPEVAAGLLASLTNQPVKSEKLVSFDDFVIDLETVRMRLQFYGFGWKLSRIEFKSDLDLPTIHGSSSHTPTPTTSSAVLTPVVESYLNEGMAKAQKNDWDGAISDFTQVLAMNPKAVSAYFYRGCARQARSPKPDVDGAIADFTMAVSLDPKLAGAYYRRGEAKLAKDDADGAMADFTQAINLDPKLAQAAFSRANLRITKADYDGAITDYTQVLAIDPNRADAYSNRGWARAAKNDLDGAITDYTQALAIDPKTPVAYYNRGMARMAQGNVDGAILDFNQTLDLDPKRAGAYYNRGNAKNTKHDFDGAIADYNQAVALDPNNALAYSNRGLARQSKGDLSGAIADYTQALTLDPKIAVAYYNRGLIKEQKDDLDGAIADSTQAIDLDPNTPQAYYNRGFAKLAKGNLSGANNDLQKFCELVPRDHYSDHARLYLWLIARAQGAKGDADQALSASLQSDWNSSPDDLVSKLAGFLLDRMSETDILASAASSDVKRDQSQHCEVWYFAGMKRLLAGDKATAIDYFHRCLATDKKDFCEYILSKAELQILEPAQPPAAAAKT